MTPALQEPEAENHGFELALIYEGFKANHLVLKEQGLEFQLGGEIFT